LFLEQNRTTTWQTDAGPSTFSPACSLQRGAIATYNELIQWSSTIEHSGLTIVVASINEVIRPKEFANRPKGQAALPELRQIRQGRDSDSSQ